MCAVYGDSAYRRAHTRVKDERGKASEYLCFDCDRPACDWSQIHDTDGESVDDYEPRCRSCHVRYDGICERNKSPESRALNSAGKKGKRPSEETKVKMRDAHTGLKHTPEIIAKKKKNWKNQYGHGPGWVIDPDTLVNEDDEESE